MKHSTIFILALALWLTSTEIYSAEMPVKVINVAVPAVSLLQAPLFVAVDAGAFKNTAWTCGISSPARELFRRWSVARYNLPKAFPAERFQLPFLEGPTRC